jgi:outer membrane protein assembly factor BamB
MDSALVGTSAARLANLNVSNSGSWSATSENSWIRMNPSSGGSRATVRLSLDPKNLTPGMHEGAVTVSEKNADGERVTVDVTFLILQPVLSVDPNSLSYQARNSNSVFNDTVRVANKGNGPLKWTARIVHGSDWITLGTTSGDGAGTIAVRVSNEGLNYFATYRDTIVVESPGAKNSPARISVQIKRKH